METTNDAIMLLLLGMILGLILMAGLYNGALYLYNRDRSFLYYMLMQFTITVVLFNMTGVIEQSDTFYGLCSLTAIFFSTLFIRSFLETARYSPQIDRVIHYFMGFILLDMVLLFFDFSLILDLHLLPFFTLIYIYLGYQRAKEGFRPAIFYLIGWFALGVSLFLNEFWIEEEQEILNPIFIGTVLEAIFFSLALSYKIKMISDEREQQKEMLIHQSKLASMGEMLGNIAHQWRQPLTYLSYSFMNIKDAYAYGELDECYLNQKVKGATQQLEFMSQTIDDFRDFYAPNRAKELFSLAQETQEVLRIMHHSLVQHEIEISLNITEISSIYNHKNAFKQVLLNLLSNAKDALIERSTPCPTITITITPKSLVLKDNAGGINPKIIHKIFEPYFSTKEGSMGIGLYMSKMIVEKNMGGRLEVSNEYEGAEFRVILR